ncbi:hypothetical protein ACWD4J_12475 [Streptomyces sp. NPDC002577]
MVTEAATFGSGHSHSEAQKDSTMGAFLVAVLAKVGVAVAEAIILRLLWQLWTTYSHHLRTAPVMA